MSGSPGRWASRITRANGAPVGNGAYVLYWMTAARRPFYNFGLERAVLHATELHRPLLVLEALRAGYEWASDRIHAFVIDGMRENAEHFAKRNVTYYPYVEPAHGEGAGLVDALAARASVVVTDDYPCFFLPRMIAAFAARSPVLVERVDSNGLFPIAATERVFTRAHSFRRFLQKSLLPHLGEWPAVDPLARADLPRLRTIPDTSRWGRTELAAIDPSELAIDHSVPASSIRGGPLTAKKLLAAFRRERLPRYDTDRSHPDLDASSGFSPYLHFGHLSAHEVVGEILADEGLKPTEVPAKVTGTKHGFWGASAPAESFLDELVTWREIGFNAAAHQPRFDEYDSLPTWAKTTLDEHRADRRHVFGARALEHAETGDPIWNAAQRELVTTGRLHNYLRMLWGKKVIEWSETPEVALATLVHLNNKYALDGRDPNSYSGIFWVFGRYDRAWGPERPVFGKVRFMSSEATRRKLKMKKYLATFGAP
jgi:deoxyribodipyrimidine photo-lyase